MNVYGAALCWPERLKAPPEPEVFLHNLYWERPEGILINKVVCARKTSSGGVRRGENPGGNFSAERLSGEPVGSFLQLFKKILPLFQFVQISYYGNNKKLSDHFTNWATKTLVNIALFLDWFNFEEEQVQVGEDWGDVVWTSVFQVRDESRPSKGTGGQGVAKSKNCEGGEKFTSDTPV